MASPTAVPPARVPAVAAAPASDEPLLPRSYDENDLRSAVGVSPLAPTAMASMQASSMERPDEDDDEQPRRPRNRKLIAASAVVITAALAATTLALVGSMNSDRYVLVCEAVRAVPHQGRGFPPWGTRPLEGESWKPLTITPETRCQPYETEDVRSLERRYLAMILDQANGLLTAREVTRLDDADALLKQALLLTRPPAREPENLATERSERRQEVERLLGDVMYWRASARMRDAATALTDAAKQFDAAAAQKPRHTADGPAWATHARKLAQELQAGPGGATPSVAPAAPTPAASTPAASERTEAPAGAALPVEPAPETGSASPPVTAPPDAGVPSGGVLL